MIDLPFEEEEKTVIPSRQRNMASTNAGESALPKTLRNTSNIQKATICGLSPIVFGLVIFFVVGAVGGAGAAAYVLIPSKVTSESATARNVTSEAPTTFSGTTLRPSVAITRSPTVPTRTPTNVPVAPTTLRPTTKATKSPTKGPATAFNIQLVFLTSMTTQETQAFIDAKTRWESVITSDFAAATSIPVGLEICDQPAATVAVPIDDILIYAEIKPIDGINKILGQAGPCGFLSGKVRLGKMTFDSADTAAMASSGTLRTVILHEMGHVLGIGTTWDNLISPQSVTTNIQYYGTQGNLGHVEVGGTGNAIIEDLGGVGTARGHWKDSVYQNELMTGYISSTNPMSRMTIRTLADLGYAVNPDAADPYTVPGGSGRRRLRNAHDFNIQNDLYTGTAIELPYGKAKPGRETEYDQEIRDYEKKKRNRHVGLTF